METSLSFYRNCNVLIQILSSVTGFQYPNLVMFKVLTSNQLLKPTFQDDDSKLVAMTFC